MKPRLFISFSGGRTSAYMTWRLMQEKRASHDIVVVFANTGQEHERSLEFVDQCDRVFGFGTVWVECVVNPEHGQGTTHKVVTFATASRDGAPFEAMIRKYGIPNRSYPHCTRELKQAPMYSFIREYGWQPGTYKVAVGIRADEIDRMTTNPELIYPLISAGINKSDVITWWSRQPFDLQIAEHQGNCVWCWKKSLRKHLTLAKESPAIFDFPARMEREYAHAGAGEGPRVFFRNHRTAAQIVAMAQQPFAEFQERVQLSLLADELDVSNGCTESCVVLGGAA